MSLQEEHRTQIDLEPRRELLDQALEGLPDKVQAMLLHERLAALGFADGAPLDPVVVEAAFEGLIQREVEAHAGKPGRKPVRVQRAWEVFRGRENEPVSSELFVEKWRSAGIKKPRHRAQSDMSYVRAGLRDFGYDIMAVREGSKTIAYRIVRYISQSVA